MLNLMSLMVSVLTQQHHHYHHRPPDDHHDHHGRAVRVLIPGELRHGRRGVHLHVLLAVGQLSAGVHHDDHGRADHHDHNLRLQHHDHHNHHGRADVRRRLRFYRHSQRVGLDLATDIQRLYVGLSMSRARPCAGSLLRDHPHWMRPDAADDTTAAAAGLQRWLHLLVGSGRRLLGQDVG